MKRSSPKEVGALSDKDLQLIKKTYSRLTELYYENRNEAAVNDLISFGELIRQVISQKRESDILSLVSVMQILKVKSKSTPVLISEVDTTINHLKNPSQKQVQYRTLIYSLRKSELFVAGCTIGIRFYSKIHSNASQFDWKEIINQLARNISISPALCIELIYQLCRENEFNCRVAVKSGLAKYIFLSHISNTLDNKYNLYKSIKLLKALSNAERTLLRDREKSLALIVYTYEDYIPVIEEICSKCYDQEYCQQIDAKKRYDNITIDQPYLWSYTESYATKNMSEETVYQIVKSLQTPISQERQVKSYAILANYTKFKKNVKKQFLQILPKNVKSLLNFVKLCVNSCEIDQANCSLINLNGLQSLVDKSESPKVGQLFKYLKQLKNKENKVGVLNDNIKKMFDMEKNADLMMERASKVPQNNEQLSDIRQILKQKDRANEFESDTLKTVKDKALNSLHTAIVQKKKLDLNSILNNVEFTDVRLLAKLLSILELNLTMNEELVETINRQKVMEMIEWIEQHYNGEMIEWSCIGQLMIMLNDDEVWKKKLGEIPEKCYWLLAIDNLAKEDQRLLYQYLDSKRSCSNFQKKIPYIVGFLGKALDYQSKSFFYKRFPYFFQIIFQNLKQGIDYKTNLMMIASFLKNWYDETNQLQSENCNKIFEDLIQKLNSIILSNLRSFDQEYQVLENSLPLLRNAERLSDNVQYLISNYGKLASQTYRKNVEKGNKIIVPYDRIKILSKLPLQKGRNILQILNFLQQNSQLLLQDECGALLDTIASKKFVYWMVYPNFFNIFSKLLSLFSKTSNPIILKNITNNLIKMVSILHMNSDVSQDQKSDLLHDLMDSLQALSQRGVYIDKQRLKKSFQKLKDQDIKSELNDIVDSFKMTSPKKQAAIQSISVEDTVKQTQPVIQIKQTQAQVQQSNVLEDLEKTQQPFNIDRLDSIGNSKTNQSELPILEALRQLKKIIEKSKPEELFTSLHPVFLQNTLKDEYKDILGYLLVRFYPNRPENLKFLARDLLSRKDKTYLSKESCYELLSKHPQAFPLAKRWKLSGKQWLDLAMLRFSEGFYGIGSQVAEYNLLKTSDLQYFYTRQYFKQVLNQFPKVKEEQDLAYFTVLIGTAARFPEIKKIFTKDKLHIKIMQIFQLYSNNLKLIGNISYALSSLAYMQADTCLDIVKQKTQMTLLLQKYRVHYNTRSVVESGACLIANLAYSNDQVKEALRQLKSCEVFLDIFHNCLAEPEISTYKQMLRAMGNLSLSVKFAQEMIDGHFCTLAVSMIEKLNIISQFDEKRAALMKILIDLVANLASHRYRLDIFHTQKLTISVMNLLQITFTHPSILMACIDTIDCLCQNPEIENYVVTQKKILDLLIDVLKTQTDQKIVVKSTRLLTNLTINPNCIPFILQANLLSVLANIVMPHFYGNKLAAEQKKKMQTYIFKIVTRIFHSKQSRQLIIKSGYLDCLICTIETSDTIQDAYVEILYSYCDDLPGFMSKRAFLAVLRVVSKKILNREVVLRCFKIIKGLSNIYEREEEDSLSEQIPQMYEKLLSSNQHRQETLILLAYHLFRSHKLRQRLQKKTDQVLQIVKKLMQDAKYTDLCLQILFVAYNSYMLLLQDESQESKQQHITFLSNGFRCNLFRMDGSSKKAKIDLNEQFQLRAYKYPDGEIKKKYVIDLRNLRDFQFNFPVSEQLWSTSVFNLDKGIFDLKKVNPKTCCSLIGSSKWGEISFINVEFDSEEEKMRFYKSLSVVFHSVR